MSEDGDLVLPLQTVVKIKIHLEIAHFSSLNIRAISVRPWCRTTRCSRFAHWPNEGFCDFRAMPIPSPECALRVYATAEGFRTIQISPKDRRHNTRHNPAGPLRPNG